MSRNDDTDIIKHTLFRLERQLRVMVRSRIFRVIANAINRIKKRRPSYLHLLCVIWLLLVYYGERAYPRAAIRQCSWYDGFEDSGRVALVADPQIIDDNTYPGRPKLLLSVSQFVVDYYLRRNWVNMNRILDPDANIFVGDLLDGGREWEDDKWYEEFKRFNRIFSGHKAKTIMSLPGNHDIGFGNTIVEHALKRFEREFGTPSSTVDLFGHTFVLADTISMMNTQNETVFQPPFKFLEAIEEKAGDKRILLTHVPLYRPKGTSCGPLRESGEALRYIRGYQYETMVTPKLTQELLRRVKPIAIFSGDDHDACEVEHRYPADDGECIAQEYIVKSASMAMGIRHPAIELVTLDNGDGKGDKKGDSRSYHASICYLPDPFYAFALYFVAAVSTGMLLGAFAVYPGLVPRVLARSDHPGTHSFLPVKRDDALGDDSSSEVNRGRLLLKGLVKDGAKVAIAPALFYLYLEWSMMH